jgi:hypothetical protein
LIRQRVRSKLPSVCWSLMNFTARTSRVRRKRDSAQRSDHDGEGLVSDAGQTLDSNDIERLLVKDSPAARVALDAFIARWQITEHPGLSTVLASIVDPLVIEPMLSGGDPEGLAEFCELLETFLVSGNHDVAMFVTYDLLEALIANRNWPAGHEEQVGPLTKDALLKLRELRGEA